MMMGFGPVAGYSYGPPQISSMMPPTLTPNLETSLSLVAAGAAMAAVAGAMYMNHTPKRRNEEVGPRDWSPRTGKCLCKRDGNGHVSST